MATYKHAVIPADGDRITNEGGELVVPDRPIIPFIEGDGIGPDIWRATQAVVDASVEHAYQGARQMVWMEIYAGEKAKEKTGEWIPEETFEALREFKVGIKGPLTTPVGGGDSLSERDVEAGSRSLFLHPSGALDRGRPVSHEGA